MPLDVIVPLPFDIIIPPLCAEVEVTLIMTLMVFTVGIFAVVELVELLEQPTPNAIIENKKEQNKILRKQKIFMRINR